MEFGRTEQLAGISFRLPDDHVDTPLTLRGSTGGDKTFHFGLTGWGDRAWIGNLYKPGTVANQFLKAYSTSFNAVELNSTFYGLPSKPVINKWVKETPDNFRFFPKICRAISHDTPFGLNRDALTSFVDHYKMFEGKASAAFLQLPPGFNISQKIAFQSFIQTFPKDLRLFVEFRDTQWIEDDATMAIMQHNGVGLVLTDVAGRRDLLHMRLLTPYLFLRFVGCGNLEIDKRRIMDWGDRLNSWFTKGLEGVAFFCHEPDNQKAPALARNILQIFNTDQYHQIPKIQDILQYDTPQKNIFEAS